MRAVNFWVSGLSAGAMIVAFISGNALMVMLCFMMCILNLLFGILVEGE